MPKNDPLAGPTHPNKSANFGSTDPNFEIPSKARESALNLLRFMSKLEKIRILTLDPPPPIALTIKEFLMLSLCEAHYSSQHQGLVVSVRPLVHGQFFWRTVLRIFPSFCLNVPYYKGTIG